MLTKAHSRIYNQRCFLWYQINLEYEKGEEEQTLIFFAATTACFKNRKLKGVNKLNMCKWLIVAYIVVFVFIFLDHGGAKKIICAAVLFKKIILYCSL